MSIYHSTSSPPLRFLLPITSVLNSGHMVPMDVPKVALDMITRFLNGEGYSAGNSMVGVSVVNIEDTAHCPNTSPANAIKRGGGLFSTAEPEITNLNKTESSSLHLGGGFGYLTGIERFAARHSNLAICGAALFCIVLSLSVFFVLRFQKMHKSRR
jgi:Serine carboxypeptidase